MLSLGLKTEPDDQLREVHGVGGAEYVFAKLVDQLAVGELRASNFEIQVGAMQYGFDIDGIIGLDFLLRTGAVIDLRRLELLPG